MTPPSLSLFAVIPMSSDALSSAPSAPVTTAVILTWLRVLEKASSTNREVTYLNETMSDVGQWPAIADEVRRAAQYHPKEAIRRWAACGYLASLTDVVDWLHAECKRPDPPEIDGDLQQILASRLSASDAAVLYDGLARATWVSSRHLKDALETPFGGALVSEAIARVRAGDIPPYRRHGFVPVLVESGVRRDEWVTAMVLGGYAVDAIGLSASHLIELKAPPVIVARALCHLNARWDVIRMFGERAFGVRTPPSTWPRDVLKVILATHGDKEVRLAVLQALEPPVLSVEETVAMPTASPGAEQRPVSVPQDATTSSPVAGDPSEETRAPKGWARSLMRKIVG